MTPQERIKADAERFTKDEGYQKLYIAGATAEHERTEDEIDKALHAERNIMQAKLNASDKQWAALLREQNVRAQVLVDALEFVIHAPATWDKTQLLAWVDSAIAKGKEALEQWKSGKGKEVGDGIH